MAQHWPKLVAGLLLAGLATPAHAACPVPNTLANGQVADASKVMDNFDAVANCADAAVTPSGSPTSGSIAVFTGPKSVSNGNLTGDVSTTGGTATSLSATGVTPGTYINPTITVDTKGRISAATNGVAGSNGTGWTELTLTNIGAETGNTTGWTMVGGGFTASVAEQSSNHVMTPIFGTYSFLASPNADPKMFQVYDLATFATAIDQGGVSAMLEVYAADTWSIGESPIAYIEFRNAAGVRTAIAISADPVQSIGQASWRSLSATGRIPPTTRSMALYLWAKRVNGTNNNVAFDGVRAFLSGF